MLQKCTELKEINGLKAATSLGGPFITHTEKIVGQLLQKEGTAFERSMKQSTVGHQCAWERPDK